MRREDYYILMDGTRTYTCPSPLTQYTAMTTLAASAGHHLEHKITGAVEHVITLLTAYSHYWVEVEDEVK